MNNLQIGDKVLRRSQRQTFRIGTIISIAPDGWANVRWHDGNCMQIRLAALIATTEEICRERKEKQREYERSRSRDRYVRKLKRRGGGQNVPP